LEFRLELGPLEAALGGGVSLYSQRRIITVDSEPVFSVPVVVGALLAELSLR
jgi:hypothetical protein